MDAVRVLITGATGYIGGRLAPRLVEEGHRVRVVVRSPEKLRDVPWHDSVEIKRGDLTDSATLSGVFDDIDVVYYLVHAMGGGGSFSDIDKRSAENVAAAAAMRGCDGSSTWAGFIRPTESCRLTCSPGSKSVGSCSTPRFRRLCSKLEW